MKLAQFLNISLEPKFADLEVLGVTHDSRQVQSGFVFVAIPGVPLPSRPPLDGHDYIPQALQRGAIAVVGTQPNLELAVPYLSVPDTRAALGDLAASFWDLDWKNAVAYFSNVAANWPSMWDGTMTATERYRVALMRYGDDLYAREQYCDAARQYQLSASIGPLDDTQSQKNANKAYAECFPPTEQTFPTPTVGIP